jgi:heptosyltransferase-1
MKRVLIVKTSSLGDVVHNLPVATDIAAAFPGAQIDWVVEESFAALPALHPAVSRTIPVALRRWRKPFGLRTTAREVRSFLQALREDRYDAIIDTQGLLKSAIVARAARGPRFGLDWASSREPLALFYDRVFDIPRTQPAVERNRTLAARALAYTPGAPVRYGITAPRVDFAWLTAQRYAVLIHSTSAAAKLWPEEDWIALGLRLRERGLAAVLPWGAAPEKQRSERLRDALPDAVVPPKLSLLDAASLLAGAACAAGVDTGLTHLAGALGVPTVGIYTATDPLLTGLYGCARAVNLGHFGVSPDVHAVARELERFSR